MLELEIYSAHFHLVVKQFPFHFPCLNNNLRQVCLSGDLVVGNVALGKVQKEFTKVRVLDRIDQLYAPVSDARNRQCPKTDLVATDNELQDSHHEALWHKRLSTPTQNLARWVLRGTWMRRHSESQM
jgi:hypothetical protein